MRMVFSLRRLCSETPAVLPFVVFVLATIIVFPAAGQPAGASIVPGRALGPVALGMPAREARAVAALFERKTGCRIDLLMAREVVIAAGSAFGGCLNIRMPSDTQVMAVSAGPFSLPLTAGIGGPAIVLVQAFGAPLIVRQGGDEAALIFSNGLAAHVGDARVGGGVVTYLAVQSPGSRSVPQIGHLEWTGAN